jgi:hypothetical protein
MRFAGANVKARRLTIDAGRDLLILSRQNQSASNSYGFNFSVTATPGAGITGIGIGGSYGKSNRRYTDTPTSLLADEDVSVTVGRTTYLLGAVLASKSNKLKLDTANFIFDNYTDKDVSGSVGVNVNIGLDPKGINPASWDGTGSLAYRNQQGITYATLCLGDITIRNRPNQDLSGLNRDIANVQRVTRDIDFDVHIPALNLAKLKKDLENSRLFLIAGTAEVPDHVKAMGKNAEKLFRRGLLNGMSVGEALDMSGSADFRQLVTQLNNLDQLRALSPDGTIPEGQLWLAALGEGYVFERSSDGRIQVSMPCGQLAGLSESQCELSLEQFKVFVKDHPEFVAGMLQGQLKLSYNQNLENTVAVLVSCVAEFPEYFVKFVDYASQVTGEGYGGVRPP